MKRPQMFPRIFSLFVVAMTTVWLAGCGGGGGSNPNPPATISVSLSPTPPTTLNTGATASLTAIVSSDSSNAGVKWTVSCTPAASSTCGSFSAASTASGAATTYTAPSALPNPATVTITAASAADSTKIATATITITAPAAISVAFSATPPTSLVAATTTSLTAVVTNDSANAGVKWTVTCGSASCGSFAPTSTASGTATTYTAPSAPPSPATVTVTATSVTDTTKTASATITITAGSGIAVAFAAAPPTTLAISTATSITANVTNDSANAGVKWTVTCGSASCGSFSATTTASGTATTYTAPGTIPTPATVSVTATSVTDTTKSVSATITIGAAIIPSGTYVYHISGQDSTGPYFIAGAIIVQNGVITAGEQDFSDRSNGYTTVFPTGAPGSSISMVGNNVQLTLNTGNTSIGVSGIETLRGPRVSATRVLLSEFDTFASGSGSLDLQTSVAAPSGGYAFSVGGIDGTTNGFALAIGGVLNISGTTVSSTGSVVDFNDGGTVGQSLALSSGSVTAPDSVGRITISVTPNSTALASFILTGYIVGTNRIQLVESQTDTLNADLGGTALGQGSHTGTFTPANVANTTYVFASAGADVNGTLNIAASFTLGNAGALTGLIALNDMKDFGALPITGGTYAVDPTGRITFANVLPSLVVGTPFGFQLYLDGNGNAMELGVDSSALSSGVAYQQSNATATFAGSFGLAGAGYGNVNNTAPGWSASGPATIASSGGAVTGYTDYNLAGATPVSNIALSGAVNSSSIISLTGLNAASTSTSNGYVYFSIDGTRFLAIENDGAQLGILQLETISP